MKLISYLTNKNTIWAVILSLILTGNLQADYSSLTPKEKDLVKRAFQQSKYYKYYKDLVNGKDDIKVQNVKKISSTPLPNGKTKHLYLFEIDLKINDQIFKRRAEFWMNTEIHNKAPEFFSWDTVKKVGAGILAGLIIGLLAAR